VKKYVILGFLAVMFVLRLWLAVNAKHGDMYNSLDWGYGAAKYGLVNFYDLPKEVWPHSRPNQPPGSIYLHLSAVSLSILTDKLIDFANLKVPAFPSKLVWWWDWNGELLTIKLPSIVADFAIVAAILTLGKMIHRYKASLVIAIVYLINPALWYSSAFWGHTDAVVSALVIWSFITLFQKRTVLSPVLLALSIFIKASWIFIGPFYLIYYLIHFRHKWYNLIVAPLVVLILTLPYHHNIFTLVPWFYDLYVHRFLPGDYTWITILAFNFWNLVFAPSSVELTTLFLGVPAFIIAWGLVLFFLIILGKKLLSNPTPKTFVWVSMLFSFAVFLFAPKMIHRYLYPAFPLLSLCLVFMKRAKVAWIAYIIMSVCYLINMYYKWWAPGNKWLESLYTDPATKVISVIYLGVFAVLCYTTLKYEKD